MSFNICSYLVFFKASPTARTCSSLLCSVCHGLTKLAHSLSLHGLQVFHVKPRPKSRCIAKDQSHSFQGKCILRVGNSKISSFLHVSLSRNSVIQQFFQFGREVIPGEVPGAWPLWTWSCFVILLWFAWHLSVASNAMDSAFPSCGFKSITSQDFRQTTLESGIISFCGFKKKTIIFFGWVQERIIPAGSASFQRNELWLISLPKRTKWRMLLHVALVYGGWTTCPLLWMILTIINNCKVWV